MATKKTEEQPARDSGREPRGTPARIPQPWGGKNVSGTAGNAGRSKPTQDDATRGGHVPQDKNAEHDAHMKHAAAHSTYTHHDGKANAPSPFNAQVGGEEDVDEPTTGQETMPKPFNTGKSATAGRGKNPRQASSKDWEG